MRDQSNHGPLNLLANSNLVVRDQIGEEVATFYFYLRWFHGAI